MDKVDVVFLCELSAFLDANVNNDNVNFIVKLQNWLHENVYVLDSDESDQEE